MGRRSVLADVLVYKFLIIGISGIAMWAYLPYVHWLLQWLEYHCCFCSVCLSRRLLNPGVLKRHAEPQKGRQGAVE